MTNIRLMTFEEWNAANIRQAAAEQIENAAIKKIIDDAERQSYDLRHPYWREELREYMEKLGVKNKQSSQD